jgi:hypothetical protein
VSIEPDGALATAEWRATAAHLLPGRGGGAPSGAVSEVVGVDQISFGEDGRITSILSLRDRLPGEEARGGGSGAFGGGVGPAGASGLSWDE